VFPHFPSRIDADGLGSMSDVFLVGTFYHTSTSLISFQGLGDWEVVVGTDLYRTVQSPGPVVILSFYPSLQPPLPPPHHEGCTGFVLVLKTPFDGVGFPDFSVPRLGTFSSRLISFLSPPCSPLTPSCSVRGALFHLLDDDAAS